MATRVPIQLAIVASLGLAAGACFDSDETSATSETSTSAGDTVVDYNDESGDTYDPNWTAEETGPGEIDCEDAIDCLIMCQIQLILDQSEEPDLSCFAECDQGLSTQEAVYLIELGECIGEVCVDMGLCGNGASDDDCLLCIATLGQDPQPPGCLEEAAACYD